MRGPSGLKRAPAAVLVALALALGGVAHAAPTDDLSEAQRLYGLGKIDAARDKLEGVLAAMPHDPQARFLNALLLVEKKRTQEAIQA
ncbi:MAG: tetratricopeptide repeat protein, partial [Bacillota bacterium]